MGRQGANGYVLSMGTKIWDPEWTPEQGPERTPEQGPERTPEQGPEQGSEPVSYTHLTLPTKA